MQNTLSSENLPQEAAQQASDAPPPADAEHHYFDCKICMDESREPVVTLCGHLYCWTCLYDWARVKRADTIPCPACNSVVEMKKVIPLYTSKEEHERRDKEIPRRPTPTAAPFAQANNGGNCAFNFGFMPFGLHFTFWNQLGAGNAGAMGNPAFAANPPPPAGGFRQLFAILPIFLVMFLPYMLDFLSDLAELMLGDWLFPTRQVAPILDNQGNYQYADLDDSLDIADVVVLMFAGLIVLSSLAFMLVKFFGRARNN